MVLGSSYAGFRGIDGHGLDRGYVGSGVRCWCGQRFGTLRELADHMPHVGITPAMLDHGAILGTDRVCKCGQRFYSSRELRQHGLEELEREQDRAVAA